jgi:hypothetical protein
MADAWLPLKLAGQAGAVRVGESGSERRNEAAVPSSLKRLELVANLLGDGVRTAVQLRQACLNVPVSRCLVPQGAGRERRYDVCSAGLRREAGGLGLLPGKCSLLERFSRLIHVEERLRNAQPCVNAPAHPRAVSSAVAGRRQVDDRSQGRDGVRWPSCFAQDVARDAPGLRGSFEICDSVEGLRRLAQRPDGAFEVPQ